NLGEELALGLVGGEAGDRLELAPLLVERHREPAFLLADRFFATGELALLRERLVEPPLELVELARELFFLREHALLDLLDLALALPRLVLEGAARLERRSLHLELARLPPICRRAPSARRPAPRLA